MSLVLVIHADPDSRARLVAALAERGIEAQELVDLETALDHVDAPRVRVVLADPVLLEQYEFDFRTQMNVRAGTEITLVALVNVADPARKKALKRHEAVLLDRAPDDLDALAAQITRLASARPAPAAPAEEKAGLGRMKVERINLEGDTLNAPVGPGAEPPMVLVVDDQEEVRLFFATLLEQRGYRVHSVSSATSALRFLGKEQAVRLVVSDINMPQMDGFELKSAMGESRIPFILIGADVSHEQKRIAKELGIAAVVAKPIQVKPFCELVRSTLLSAT